MNTAVVVGAVAATLAVFATWRPARYAVTAVHEAGHAIVAVILGGSLKTIRVRHDTSGETTYSAPRSRLGAAVCAASGYPAPMVLGAAASGALALDHQRTLLAALAALVALSAPLWRGWWTLVVALACIAPLVAAAWLGAAAATGACSFVAALGALGGLRASLEAVLRRTVRGDGSDVSSVAVNLFLPVFVSRVGLLVAAVALASFAVWTFDIALRS